MNISLGIFIIILKFGFIFNQSFDVEDTDKIDIYFLRSFPHYLISTDFGKFSISTSGIAMKESNKNQEVVFQFLPQNFSNSFLPEIKYDGQNIAINWNKLASLKTFSGIDKKYWKQSTYLATTSGVVYKKFFLWAKSYEQQNKYFSPLSICSNIDYTSCFILSNTWETFLEER